VKVVAVVAMVAVVEEEMIVMIAVAEAMAEEMIAAAEAGMTEDARPPLTTVVVAPHLLVVVMTMIVVDVLLPLLVVVETMTHLAEDALLLLPPIVLDVTAQTPTEEVALVVIASTMEVLVAVIVSMVDMTIAVMIAAMTDVAVMIVAIWVDALTIEETTTAISVKGKFKNGQMKCLVGLFCLSKILFLQSFEPPPHPYKRQSFHKHQNSKSNQILDLLNIELLFCKYPRLTSIQQEQTSCYATLSIQSLLQQHPPKSHRER
jgi:hypothetical protein